MKKLTDTGGFSAIAEFSLKRPITITMIFLSLVVIGLISARLLPLEQWPQVKFPFINVNVAYPSATPKEVEQNITRPLEEALATIGDIENINSRSGTNGANIGIMFKSGVDIDEKTMLVKEQIDLTRPLLPDDVRRIVVNKAQSGDDAIMELRITGDIDLEHSYDVINRYLVRPIQRVAGVARVELQGLEPRELRIMIDNDALKMYNISFDELTQKINDSNFAIASGDFKTGYTRDSKQLSVVPKTQLLDLDKFKNLVLNSSGVRLADVAKIDVVNGERNYARHLDRKYSVGLEVYNDSTSNLVDVAARVLEKIEEISKTPQMQGIQLVFLNNQAQSVKDSLNEVIMAGVLGALLSLIVLFIFIRDVQTTLLVSLSIPISITITLGILYFLGLSLNVLSLMGLMLAIGMLVDNSVVISESIFTRKSSGKYNIATAIKKGVSDVMVPVIAGTLTSICVFLPIVVGAQDMVSLFLTHVAASIIAALVISLFLSITVVPLIISRLNRNIIQKPNNKKTWVDSLKVKYVKALSFTLAHRWVTFFSIVVIVTLGIVVNIMFVKDEEGFQDSVSRDFWMPYHVDGSFTLDRLKKDVDKIENYLYANQDKFNIRTVYSYYEEDGFVGTKIYLVDEDKASKSIVAIKKEIMENMPKITIGKPNFRWSRGRGNDSMSVYLQGDSQEVMKQMLPSILLELNKVDGIAGATVEKKNNREELQIVINRERAIRLGVDPDNIAQSVSIAMRGMNLRDIVTESGEMPVILRFYKTGEFKLEQLSELPIKTNNGNQVTLATVADIVNTSSPQTIRRHNRMGAIQIEIDLDDEVNKKDMKATIETIMDRINYPSGYQWTFDGNTRNRGMQSSSMTTNIFIAIALIFIVMAALFESMLFPFCVISSIAFSYIGVFFFFAITGTQFTIMAAIGMLILIGVVVNNGIVLIDHINQLRIKGMVRRDAVLQAGKDRLRPILMTVSTTVVGLIPLAMSVSTIGGQGPAYFPMARAIIGGLTFSTIVSLLVLPSLYCWLDDLRIWTKDRLFHQNPAQVKPH
ncbi:RND multidrug efflux transporter; Acriflavin resistance protein [hydrothermal vent metagenome]|uniref:RND multidrug efflux transporter Acriflavin resistance protein n=1 Tax=hydrothermal vent metagenome TaxID=652676 RepID=A0A3B0V8C3_9ZZZZ